MLKPHPKFRFEGKLFESDLRFFQLVLVLINKSCPIKNIDLKWNSEEPDGCSLTQITGTEQALSDSRSGLVRDQRICQTPHFCQIVGKGCRKSDEAAALRAGLTGKPQVYRCHAGLTDVAVPVMCDGDHIATLFTGQVLLAQPDDASFEETRQRVAWLGQDRVPELRQAYFQVPVVTEEDIRDTISILQIFADYLSAAWKRLITSLAAQELQLRDSLLLRKEMAHILLNGSAEENTRLRAVARALKITSYPNRVMVIAHSTSEIKDNLHAPSFDLGSTRVLYAIEDATANMRNVIAIGFRRGICVFFTTDLQAGEAQGEMKAYSLAQKLACHVRQRCGISVRIGVGRCRKEWNQLADSYHEALSAALASSKPSISIYKGEPETVRDLRSQVRAGCEALLRRDFQRARSDLMLVSSIAARSQENSEESLSMMRELLFSSLDAILDAAQKLGCGAEELEGWRHEFCEDLHVAPSPFELQESWLHCIERIIGETRRLYSGRHPQLIYRACQEIERSIGLPQGARPVSLSDLARALGVSSGHLSRTFRKVMGTTLERYTMQKQVERGARLLLDPTSRVSEVAEKCGFSNPSYFARVFRKIVGCSPTGFSIEPVNHELGFLNEESSEEKHLVGSSAEAPVSVGQTRYEQSTTDLTKIVLA